MGHANTSPGYPTIIPCTPQTTLGRGTAFFASGVFHLLVLTDLRHGYCTSTRTGVGTMPSASTMAASTTTMTPVATEE